MFISFVIMIFKAFPPAFLLPFCILAETLFGKRRYRIRDRFPGAFYIGLMPAALVAVAWPLQQLWQALNLNPLVSIAALPELVQFGLLLLFVDFLRYWEHRFEHRFWWPVHAVHHAPTELHASNSYGHPLQALPEFVLVSIPFSLIGTSPAMPFLLAIVVGVQNLIIHSPLRIHAGRLRAVYVDNRFHRIHHSVEARHVDHNFSLVFSFWDRIFGTWAAADCWPETGIPHLTQKPRLSAWLLQPLEVVNAKTPADEPAIKAWQN